LHGGELLTQYAFEAARAPTPRRHDIALAAYDRCLRHAFRGKRLVERIVGTAVAFPSLLDRTARVLAHRRDMADLLVGVTGDFVPPSGPALASSSPLPPPRIPARACEAPRLPW
jgi:hypothetical protein